MSAVSWEDLQATIGLQAALKLCDEYGGTTVIVPARPKATHPIARAIGAEAAKILYRSYGNTRLSLPLGPTRGQRGRRTRVAQLIDQGYSVPEAARLADVHERTVYNVKATQRHVETPLLDRLAPAKKP